MPARTVAVRQGRSRRAPARADRDWTVNAACRRVDPGMFFPDCTRPDAAVLVLAASRVCAACPVAAPCLDDAVARRDQHGICGGLTGPERARIGTADPAKQDDVRHVFAAASPDGGLAAEMLSPAVVNAARWITARAPWLIPHVVSGLPLQAAARAAGWTPPTGHGAGGAR